MWMNNLVPIAFSPSRAFSLSWPHHPSYLPPLNLIPADVLLPPQSLWEMSCLSWRRTKYWGGEGELAGGGSHRGWCWELGMDATRRRWGTERNAHQVYPWHWKNKHTVKQTDARCYLWNLAFVGCAGFWQRVLGLSALGDEGLVCVFTVPGPVIGAAMNTNNPQLRKAPVCCCPGCEQ